VGGACQVPRPGWGRHLGVWNQVRDRPPATHRPRHLPNHVTEKPLDRSVEKRGANGAAIIRSDSILPGANATIAIDDTTAPIQNGQTLQTG